MLIGTVACPDFNMMLGEISQPNLKACTVIAEWSSDHSIHAGDTRRTEIPVSGHPHNPSWPFAHVRRNCQSNRAITKFKLDLAFVW